MSSDALTLDALAPLLTDEFEIAGCYLVPTEVADERLKSDTPDFHSELYGRGPDAWSRHWLIVPLTEPQGRRRGLIWVDDPRDRLRPTRARRAGDSVLEAVGHALGVEHGGAGQHHRELVAAEAVGVVAAEARPQCVGEQPQREVARLVAELSLIHI